MADKIEVTNPFSGKSAMLTEEENKLYLSIKLAEMVGTNAQNILKLGKVVETNTENLNLLATRVLELEKRLNDKK